MGQGGSEGSAGGGRTTAPAPLRAARRGAAGASPPADRVTHLHIGARSLSAATRRRSPGVAPTHATGLRRRDFARVGLMNDGIGMMAPRASGDSMAPTRPGRRGGSGATLAAGRGIRSHWVASVPRLLAERARVRAGLAGSFETATEVATGFDGQ